MQKVLNNLLRNSAEYNRNLKHKTNVKNNIKQNSKNDFLNKNRVFKINYFIRKGNKMLNI